MRKSFLELTGHEVRVLEWLLPRIVALRDDDVDRGSPPLTSWQEAQALIDKIEKAAVEAAGR